MSNNDGLMADPYAASGSAAPPPPLPSAVGSASGADDLFLNVSSEPAAQPDFLFEESYDQSFRRSWGERLTYHVGCAYSTGLLFGGSYGLMQGLAASKGERQRIRTNSVLNAMGKHGPGTANSLGCIAMMCSIFESIAYNVRGEDDILNTAGAAALTGMLYKSTAGPRMAGTAALGLGAIAAVGSFVSRQAGMPRFLKNIKG